MNFLRVSDLSEALLHQTIESEDQHKYARLAMASYYPDPPSDLLQGFARDDELSTPEHAVLHDATTGETVIAYRGTSNFADVKTDAHLALGREAHTERYKRSEQVFEAVRRRYNPEMISVTGHSLGGGIALHVGEKYDVASHTFNAAISPTQVFDPPETGTAIHRIYHTPLDPVSVGAQVIGANHDNREVVRVHNHPAHHPHALENFYGNDAKPHPLGGLVVRKESVQQTIERHQSKFKSVLSAWDKVRDANGYLDSVHANADVVSKIPRAIPRAVSLAKKGVVGSEYTSGVSQSLNPYPGVNLDPEYQWSDREVITPLYRLGQVMRTSERRDQDALMDLAESQVRTELPTDEDGAPVGYRRVMG